MFDPTSRYYNLDTATISVPDADEESGTREIRFVRRRFIARSENITTLAEHTVAQGERLDQITARYTGDPTQFWRICDVNNVVEPEELEEIGRVVAIAVPGL
jgi:hypothetical protein